MKKSSPKRSLSPAAAEGEATGEIETTTALAIEPTVPSSSPPPIDRPPYVHVPYRWSRTYTEDLDGSLPLVYYITPSGRILQTREDAKEYIQCESSCKCYLNAQLPFDDVFSFDINIGGLTVLPKTDQALGKCLQWYAEQELSTDFTKRLQVIHKTMQEKAVHERTKLFAILGERLGPEDRRKFDWDLVNVLDNGHIYLKNLSKLNLKHLAWELMDEVKVQQSEIMATSPMKFPKRVSFSNAQVETVPSSSRARRRLTTSIIEVKTKINHVIDLTANTEGDSSGEETEIDEDYVEEQNNEQEHEQDEDYNPNNDADISLIGESKENVDDTGEQPTRPKKRAKKRRQRIVVTGFKKKKQSSKDTKSPAAKPKIGGTPGSPHQKARKRNYGCLWPTCEKPIHSADKSIVLRHVENHLKRYKEQLDKQEAGYTGRARRSTIKNISTNASAYISSFDA